MRRIRTILPVFLVGLLMVAACGDDDEDSAGASSGDFPMTVQNCGRDITIDEPPERVLTVGTTSVNLLYSAGAADRITTRSSEYFYPLGFPEEVVADVPLISRDAEPSLEVILGEEPNLVISWGLNETPEEQLAGAGVVHLVNAGFCDNEGAGPSPDNKIDFEDIYSDIELYGKLMGTDVAAENAIEDLRRRVSTVKDQVRDAPRRTAAYLGMGEGRVSGYGKQSLSQTHMDVLGLENVFADVETRTFDLNIEELIDRDPDIVVLGFDQQSGNRDDAGQNAIETFLKLPGVGNMTAVRNGDLYGYLQDYISGADLFAVDGLEKMAADFGTSGPTS